MCEYAGESRKSPNMRQNERISPKTEFIPSSDPACTYFSYNTLGLAAVRSKKISQLYWGKLSCYWKYSNIIIIDGVLWKAMRTGVYVDYIISYFIP